MYNNKKIYGILRSSTTNIGEEIQAVAQSRFIPHIDEYIHKETLKNFVSNHNSPVKLIMNAWLMWQPHNFPPPSIDPLLISIHVRDEIKKTFLTPKTREFFLRHAPIGCRDIYTVEWLKKEGIDSYFSGCLTLTLLDNTLIKKEKFILCIDTSKEVFEEVKRRTSLPVYRLSKQLTPYQDFDSRFYFAKIYLRLFSEAHCIISPNLHTLLPCLSFGTPVLRLITKPLLNDSRFTGYEDFFILQLMTIFYVENAIMISITHQKIRTSI